ncbi:MAG: hypothetical protein DKINENOH_05621 [bacterium]|nr:hypothetical protein [bacterium]NUM64622.1 type II toxin-antitoxin system Phd/YefM family antitoxin [candidate division KSB1 bacterium]
MIHELDIKELANLATLRDVLRRVSQNGEQYIIKENDRADAVLIPLRDLEDLKRRQEIKQRAWDDLLANMREVHALNAEFSAEEVEADVDAAIQEVRRARKRQ